MRLLLSLLVFLHTIHAALLDPISTTQPNTTYFPPKVHPQGPVRLNVPGGTPIPTSAWWSDLLLPQSNAIFTRIVSHPYQLRYRSNTNNGVAPYGIVASHTSSRMLSPFSNITTLSGIKKPRIQSYTSTADVGVGLSAVEHTTSGQSLEVIGFDLFSVTVRLFGAGGSYIQPLVHGMAYITAIYKNLTPFLFTQGCSITSVNGINANNTTTPLTFTSTRFRLTTSINTTWILYTYTPITMIWNTPTSLSGNVVYDGVIRVALSDGSEYMDTTLDAHADTYPTGASLFADVVAGVPLPPITPVTSTPTSTPIIGNSTVNTTETPSTPTSTPTSSPTSIPTRPTPLGLYVITWNVVGTGTLLHWALPHHVECIDPERTLLTNLTIQSSNKGMMTAFIGNKWNMNENGLTDYKWLPPRDADPTQIPALLKILNVELDVLSDILSMKNIMNTNTLTFGRKIYRAAQLLLVAETQFSNIAAYTPQISILRTALTLYLTRNITNKLGYDSTWLGIVSQVGYDDKNADGGNTYYHDHHQQYGYIIGAAAILAHFDPSWIPQYGSLIDTLIRDVANPSTSDVFFPQFRYFDWYNGHTYTRGLAISDAGRYLSSASEEIASHYAIYLWGMVTKRTDLQNLGNIMFGIARRTINRYMYMLSDSTIHPEFFVTNSVVAAYYDTKIDHYTLAPSALVLPAVNISAWQIRPVTPVTELIRYSDWTQQEWENVLGVAVGASTDVWSRSLALVSLSIFNTSASAQIQKLAGVGVDETLSISFTMYWAATRPPPGTITRPPVVIHAPPSGTPPPPSTTPSSTRESASWGWIIGTIIGIFVGIVLLVVVVIFCCIRREPGEAYTKKSSDGTTDL